MVKRQIPCNINYHTVSNNHIPNKPNMNRRSVGSDKVFLAKSAVQKANFQDNNSQLQRQVCSRNTIAQSKVITSCLPLFTPRFTEIQQRTKEGHQTASKYMEIFPQILFCGCEALATFPIPYSYISVVTCFFLIGREGYMVLTYLSFYQVIQLTLYYPGL